MKIEVYTGISIENKCGNQLHPLTEINSAIKIINSDNPNVSLYSNSPEFTSCIKYYGEKKGYKVEFFLNGESMGNDIEKIFDDFNKAFGLLDEITHDI